MEDPVEQFGSIAAKIQNCGFTISNDERNRLNMISKTDSQQNSALSQKQLGEKSGSSQSWKLEVEAVLGEMLEACNLGCFLEKNVLLPGTI